MLLIHSGFMNKIPDKKNSWGYSYNTEKQHGIGDCDGHFYRLLNL